MRVHHQKNAQAGVQYFVDSRKTEYYGAGTEKRNPSIYFGKTAEMLGLTPDVEVTEEVFAKLANNIDYRNGERLTARNREGRRAFTDLTWSGPKSVDLAWAHLCDDRLLDAVQESALTALKEVEKDAATRVNHSRGVMSLKKTGNLLGVGHLHTLSRPVNGHSDPGLHFHGCVVNCTWDEGRQRFTAVDLSIATRDSGYYNSIFLSELANRVQQLGYTIERSEHNFEITGFSRELIEKFSRRSVEIEKTAKALGITSPEAKDKLGATTRVGKDVNEVPHEKLHEKWRSRLTPEEDAMVRSAAPADHDVTPEIDKTLNAIEHSLDHNLANQSVVRSRQVVRDALLNGIGQTSLEKVQDKLDRMRLISFGKEEKQELTTHQVLDEERSVVEFVKWGRGACSAINPDYAIKQGFLSDEQRQAISGVLSSRDRLMVVQGRAGTGKTTLMRSTISGMEEAGKHVVVLAPQAETAHQLLREQEGFDANTVASFLLNEDAQADAAGGVLWIDEAGQMGMEDLNRITKIARRIDARVVLSGDRRQHKSVARGETMRLVEQEGGITPFEVKTIRRQTDEKYREAVQALSDGDITKGLDLLDKEGHIHQIEDDDERATAIAKAYADAVDKGVETLVVSPSHAERQAVTESIRDELKARGHIDASKEHEATVLVDRRLSEAKKQDPLSYTPGEDLVEFHRKAKGGWEPGMRAVVAKVEEDCVFVQAGDRLASIPIEAARSFNVYRAKTTHFAPGDRLRITKNKSPEEGKNAKRLNNGSLVTLKGFAKNGDLVLTNGQKVSPRFGHLDHGVTMTSYASQGKGFSNILIAQSAMSAGASSVEQAYVSSSRGKQSIQWFTDSLDELKTAIGRERPSKMASELAKQSRDRQQAERLRRLARENVARQQRWQEQQRQQEVRV